MPIRTADTWGWEITDVANNSGSDLNRTLSSKLYTIGDNATYRDDLVWQDRYTRGESWFLGDTDGGDRSDSRARDGIIVAGGELQNLNEVEIYEAVVTTKDGITHDIRILAVQTVEGFTFLRLSDSTIKKFVDAGYGRGDVKTLLIGDYYPPRTYDSYGGLEADAYDRAFPCFAAGTLIGTGDGEVAVETLAAGDEVLTRDHALRPIRWIGSRRLDAQALKAQSNMRPIRIRAGALGNGLPRRDLVVSPQHRVLVQSRIAARMFGSTEVLVPAKALTELEGIEIAGDLREVTYVHFMCDRHEVVYSEGAPTESLYAGAEALKSVDKAARDEILRLFPELARADHTATAARAMLTVRDGRNLRDRHRRNHKPLLEAV